MRSRNLFIISFVILSVMILSLLVSSSEAFNKFQSAEDERRISVEYTDNIRAIKGTNEQILEQLKITNELLQKQVLLLSGHGSGGVAVPGSNQ